MSDYRNHVRDLVQQWRQVLTATRIDAVVIAAGSPQNYFLDDQAPPYRANPHFSQWVGGAECPHSLLLVTHTSRPRLYFQQVEDYWHQPPVRPELEDAIDVEVHADGSQLLAAVAKAVERSNRTAYIGEAQAGSNLPFDDINPPLLLNALHYGRAKKTPFEIACMRTATAIAVKGHRAAAAAFEAGASEFDIHMAYIGAARQADADLPYASIVALNGHAGVLHYQHRDPSAPNTALSFLIDAGARHRGYAADITRTYAAAGAGAFAELVADLDARQQAIIASIHTGMSYVDLHESAHRHVAHVLVNHGLVRCTAEAAFERHITDVFFPHGLGHLIGIQTHDVAGHMISAEGGLRPPPDRYPALRLTRPIENGQVFTIEPGLYFIPMLLRGLRSSPAGKDVDWPQVDALMAYGGIRIEDNVLVTESGIENFTRDAFATQ
ncbi:MAG: Xaa-Pro dipeptidase [Gammaproteobacteria bacterium]|nr:Xaa-Pro dipeptidase [Gammaproteobacteria bacterium]